MSCLFFIPAALRCSSYLSLTYISASIHREYGRQPALSHSTSYVSEIFAAQSNVKLKLVYSFSEPYNDILTIADNGRSNMSIKERFHGSLVPFGLISTNNSIVIHFNSDDSGQTYGFKLNLMATDFGGKCQCFFCRRNRSCLTFTVNS